VTVLCNDYNPGDLVDWRPDPSSSWSAALVVMVEHQGDHAGMFTVVTVAPLDVDGHATLEHRIVAGLSLVSCLRRPGAPDGPEPWWPLASRASA